MRRLEYRKGTSNKFWELTRNGKTVTVRFGKIGTTGQTKVKKFAKPADANVEEMTKVREKLNAGYVEVMPGAEETGAPAAKPKTLKQELAILEPILTKSIRPYVRITAKPVKKPLPLWCSKGCDGRPYLPKTEKWPMRGSEHLAPVLQIDLAEVPKLSGFPRKGLVSLFWSEDYQEQRLFYFEKRITDESKLWTEFPPNLGNPYIYPYRKSSKLTFELRKGSVCWGDFRFERLVGGKDVVHALFDSPHQREIWSHVWDRSGGADTRLGGWASPQQEDPRVSAKHAKYETQLLQIQNDNFTHNLFMKPADLAKAKFDDVLFYEACD